MPAKKANPNAKLKPDDTAPPVLLYPLHGSENVQYLTQTERLAQLRQNRILLRKHWNHEGVKALVGLLELTTQAMTQEALLRGATEYDRGQAGAGVRMLASLRSIVTGEEEEG